MFTASLGWMVRRLGMGVALVLLAAGLTVPAHGDDAAPVVTFGPASRVLPQPRSTSPPAGRSRSSPPAASRSRITRWCSSTARSTRARPMRRPSSRRSRPSAASSSTARSTATSTRRPGTVEGMSGVVNVTTNQLPVAKFTAKASGQNVTFDASASSDPDGSITKYQWDFDDDGGDRPDHRQRDDDPQARQVVEGHSDRHRQQRRRRRPGVEHGHAAGHGHRQDAAEGQGQLEVAQAVGPDARAARSSRSRRRSRARRRRPSSRAPRRSPPARPRSPPPGRSS